MDHTEAIEIIQKALAISQSPPHLEDNTAKALPSSSPPTFANGETGKIDSETSRALLQMFFQYLPRTRPWTADRLHSFLHTIPELHTRFRNMLLQHDFSHHRHLLGLEERGKMSHLNPQPCITVLIIQPPFSKTRYLPFTDGNSLDVLGVSFRR